MRGAWWFAAVQPAGLEPGGTWVLPKGLVDEGETVRETAVREVARGDRPAAPPSSRSSATRRYTYTWDGERIFKVVSFFLLRPVGGRIGVIPPEMEVEVAQARWLPLDDPSSPGVSRRARDGRAGTRALVGLSSHPSR